MDACFQTAAPALWAGNRSDVNAVLIPAIIDEVLINQVPSRCLQGIAQATSDYVEVGRSDVMKNYKSDSSVYDPETGVLLFQLSGLRYHKLDTTPSDEFKHTYIEVAWRPDATTLYGLDQSVELPADFGPADEEDKFDLVILKTYGGQDDASIVAKARIFLKEKSPSFLVHIVAGQAQHDGIPKANGIHRHNLMDRSTRLLIWDKKYNSGVAGGPYSVSLSLGNILDEQKGGKLNLLYFDKPTVPELKLRDKLSASGWDLTEHKFPFENIDANQSLGGCQGSPQQWTKKAVQALFLLLNSGAPLSSIMKASLDLANRQMVQTLRLGEPMEPSKSLASYGMDSLAAVEFRNWARLDLKAELTTLEIANATSLHALCEKIVARIPRSSS
ncbi:hypothetical protein VP1G_05405 [Cytospora mali]|uniref:Carrier domain-containing protein n=1 Tax=Cytospora mali TaxID=578113 RepID=A0A194V2H7_CYTMA|nr:hypothetical protein VP1G_05405 [Valsa mali var. pyri (nom. inval.)]